MTRILATTFFLLSTITLANSASQIRFSVAGHGQFVCSAEESIQHAPVVARGETQMEAQSLALSECSKHSNDGTAFFCSVISCEQDKGPRDSKDMTFDVQGDANTIKIAAHEPKRFECSVKQGLSYKEYVAAASTQTEARVIAKQACMTDPKSSSGDFFCQDQECQFVAPTQCQRFLGICISKVELNISDKSDKVIFAPSTPAKIPAPSTQNTAL